MAFYFISFFLFKNKIKVHHCPPGPLGKHCRDHHDDGANGANGGNGGNGSDGSNGGSNGYYYTSSSNAAYYDDGNGGGNGSGGGSSGNAFQNAIQSSTGQFALITMAALAASVAIAAMYMSNRNQNNVDSHPLNGIIKQRIGLFSRMAERTNCATCRPEAAVKHVADGSLDYNTLA